MNLCYLLAAIPLICAEPERAEIPAKDAGVRAVVQAIAIKAAEIQKLPPKERPTGDDLTDAYVRTAATAAIQLEAAVRVPAFLIGLGIGLDDSTILSSNPLTKKLCAVAESADERKGRIGNLGSPTICKRIRW